MLTPGEKRRSRGSRRLIALAVFATGIVVLAACGKSSSSSSSSSSSGQATKKVGGTLVDLLPTIVNGLDTDDVGGTSNNPLAQAYGTLVSFGTKVESDGLRSVNVGDIVPQLAASWTDNQGTYTFKLKQGIKSCNGNELTSADVVWTMARIKSLTGAAPTSFSALNVGNVFDPTLLAKTATAAQKVLNGEAVAIDKYTVQIKVQKDNGLLLDALDSPLVGPIDSVDAMKHATASDPWAHAWLHTHTDGFGPYCTSSFTPGSAATLKANDSFTPKMPYFQQVQMKAVPQDSNRLSALLSGDAQMAEALNSDEYAKVSQSSNAKTLSEFESLNIALSMNYNDAPFGPNGAAAAADVRQAIAAAIPYDDIIKNAMGGQGKAVQGLIPEMFSGAKTYPDLGKTDVTKAKQDLVDAGYPGGSGIPTAGLQLYFAAESASQLQPIAIRIQSALAAIGIKITLNPIPQAQLSTRVFVTDDVPMVLQIIGAGIYDSAYYTQLWYVPTKDGGTTGLGNYNNPQVTALYNQAATTTGAQRNSLMGQAQDLLVKDLPQIPIAYTPLQVAVAKSIVGVQIGSFGSDYAAMSEG